MRCPQCRQENLAGARFCNACGALELLADRDPEEATATAMFRELGMRLRRAGRRTEA